MIAAVVISIGVLFFIAIANSACNSASIAIANTACNAASIAIANRASSAASEKT